MCVESRASPLANVTPVWSAGLPNTVTKHLSLLIHTHPTNTYKHNIETDCIMLRLCDGEYSCAHVVRSHKGVINAACRGRWRRQQRRIERGDGEKEEKEEGGCCFAPFKALSHIDHSVLVRTLIWSISHGSWTKRPNVPDYDIREGAINVRKNSSGSFKHNFSMKSLLFISLW